MSTDGKTDMTEPLKDRLLRATAGSCTCDVKTPELQYHAPQCHYRLFEEAREEINRLNGIYLSAVKGRREFRDAFRRERENHGR